MGIPLRRECGSEAGHPPAQGLDQPQPRRPPAALDRALGDVQHGGRLGLGQPLVEQQVERLALLRRQRLDLAMEVGPGGEAIGVVGGVRMGSAAATAEGLVPARSTLAWLAPRPWAPE